MMSHKASNRRTHKRGTHRRRTHRRRTHKHKTLKRRGGSATAFPLKFFKADAPYPAGPAGNDLTGAYGNMVRARLNTISGGARRMVRKTIKKCGGFVPTVMEGFTQLAAKYVTPLALFAGYKLLKNRTKTKKSKK